MKDSPSCPSWKAEESCMLPFWDWRVPPRHPSTTTQSRKWWKWRPMAVMVTVVLNYISPYEIKIAPGVGWSPDMGEQVFLTFPDFQEKELLPRLKGPCVRSDRDAPFKFLMSQRKSHPIIPSPHTYSQHWLLLHSHLQQTCPDSAQ